MFFKKKQKKEFKEKIVETSNVNEELLKVSKEYNIPLSKLDFDLLETKTLIKFPENKEFLIADKEIIDKFMKEENLLNPEFKIKQIYKIKIKKYIPSNFEILGEMRVNENFTYAEFNISKDSILNTDFEKIKEELNKKKIKNSLLINIFDLMDSDINRLIEILKTHNKLEDNFLIKLCRGIEPIKAIKGKVIYNFKKPNKKIYPIKKGDVLIEIILPREGRNGRNCRGEIIIEKSDEEFIIPSIDYEKEVIEKKLIDDKIVFIAKKDGYVLREDSKYTIKNEMEVRQVNLKTGSIEANKSDVKLRVKESNILKEAIADNMVVETKELHVKGNIGNKAKVKADKLEIDGQTHKNSIIISSEAIINVHKGDLRAKKVFIKRLEGGKVKADEVEIDLALGGEIYAKEIKINNLLSHNKCFSSKKIKICNEKGEENILAISPKKVLDDLNVESIENKIKDIDELIQINKKEYEKLKKIYLKNRDGITEYKKMYLENKKRNLKTSPTILKKLKEFQDLTRRIEKFKNKINSLLEDKKVLKEELEYLQSGIFSAKILSNTPWKPFNRIVFELIEPDIKFVYDTKENEGKCGFKIKSDFELKIVKIKVENDICSKG